MSSLLRSILAGAGLAAVSAGAALAYPATVTSDLNLRSGPGTGYGVIATMPAGARVDVRNCLSNGWCQLGFAGTVGYASGNYLAGAPAASTTVVVPGPEYIAPEYYEYAYLYPPYWQNGYFYYWYGGRWRHVRRDRHWWDSHRERFVRAQREHRRPGPRPGVERPGRPHAGPGPRPGGRPDAVRPNRPNAGPGPRPGRRPDAMRPNRPNAGPQARPGRGAERPNRGGGGANFNAGPRGGGAPAARDAAPRGGGGRGDNDRRNR